MLNPFDLRNNVPCEEINQKKQVKKQAHKFKIKQDWLVMVSHDMMTMVAVITAL